MEQSTAVIAAILVIVIIALVYWKYRVPPTQGAVPVVVDKGPPTSDPPTGTLYNSGATYADVVLELFPDTNYRGYTAENANVRELASFSNTEVGGGKQVVFARTSGGKQVYLYKSLKSAPGTILEVTNYIRSGGTSRAFIVLSRNIPDLQQYLESIEPLCCGNTGIMLKGWEHLDMEFRITVLDKAKFEAQILRRRNECRATTTGWGYTEPQAVEYCEWDGVVKN